MIHVESVVFILLVILSRKLLEKMDVFEEFQPNTFNLSTSNRPTIWMYLIKNGNEAQFPNQPMVVNS